MRGNGRVKVLAHHHVAEQRLDGGRIFLPIGKRIHQRTPTASCSSIAGGNGRLHALPRQQHHFAGLARLQQRARKLARLVGALHHQRRNVGAKQRLHQALEALLRAHGVRQRVEHLPRQLGVLHQPPARRAGGCRRAFHLFKRGNAAFKRCYLAMRRVNLGTRGIALLHGAGHACARRGLGGLHTLKRLGRRPAVVFKLLRLLLGMRQRQLHLFRAPFHQLRVRQAVRQRLLRLRQPTPRVLLLAFVVATLPLQAVKLSFHVAALVGILLAIGLKLRHLVLRSLQVAAHGGKLRLRLIALLHGRRALGAPRL